jgi:hypothetical protein
MKLENWITIGTTMAVIIAMFINTLIKARLDKSITQDVRATVNPNANQTTAGSRLITFFGSMRVAVFLHLLNIITALVRFYLNRGVDPVLLALLFFSITYVTLIVPIQVWVNRIEKQTYDISNALREFMTLSNDVHQATSRAILALEAATKTKTRKRTRRKPKAPPNSN